MVQHKINCTKCNEELLIELPEVHTGGAFLSRQSLLSVNVLQLPRLLDFRPGDLSPSSHPLLFFQDFTGIANVACPKEGCGQEMDIDLTPEEDEGDAAGDGTGENGAAAAAAAAAAGGAEGKHPLDWRDDADEYYEEEEYYDPAEQKTIFQKKKNKGRKPSEVDGKDIYDDFALEMKAENTQQLCDCAGSSTYVSVMVTTIKCNAGHAEKLVKGADGKKEYKVSKCGRPKVYDICLTCKKRYCQECSEDVHAHPLLTACKRVPYPIFLAAKAMFQKLNESVERKVIDDDGEEKLVTDKDLPISCELIKNSAPTFFGVRFFFFYLFFFSVAFCLVLFRFVVSFVFVCACVCLSVVCVVVTVTERDVSPTLSFQDNTSYLFALLLRSCVGALACLLARSPFRRRRTTRRRRCAT